MSPGAAGMRFPCRKHRWFEEQQHSVAGGSPCSGSAGLGLSLSLEGALRQLPDAAMNRSWNGC